MGLEDVLLPKAHFLDCCWVGSLDFNFLVETKGFPLDPPKG